MTSVPLIYSPTITQSRLSLLGRATALAVSLAALSMLVTARMLTPSPTGTGTHEALGFGECQFLARSGLPCPTCGMTTATAHFVRGHWLTSFYTQPMGFVVAFAAAVTFWAGLYIAMTGRPS